MAKVNVRVGKLTAQFERNGGFGVEDVLGDALGAEGTIELDNVTISPFITGKEVEVYVTFRIKGSPRLMMADVWVDEVKS